MNLEDTIVVSQADIEKGLAANLYLNPIATLKECEWLQPEIILTHNIRELWKRAKETIDVGMKEDAAQDVITQIALELGIAVDLMKQSTYIAGYERPSAYAQEIVNRARNVRVSVMLPEIARALSANDHGKVDELIGSISSLTRPYTNHVRTTADIHESFIKFINGDNKRSIETFVHGIDEGLGGFAKQNLIVIGARPGMGKTALSWQIARDVSISGDNVAFFSLEMSEIDLWMRAACPEAGVLWRDVLNNHITPEQKRKLISVSEELRDLLGERLTVDDRTQTSGSIWQYVSTHRPGLVIVDHLRLLQDRIEKGSNENKRLGVITMNMKNMAKAFNCAVLCLAQLNRQVEGQQDKRPTLKDLRDSGEIEENADVVLFIHSPDFYQEDKVKNNIRGVQLWAEKNRNGQRMIKINLAYDMFHQRFEHAQVDTINLDAKSR
jgi:replicative DNA helicase